MFNERTLNMRSENHMLHACFLRNVRLTHVFEKRIVTICFDKRMFLRTFLRNACPYVCF